MVGILGPFGASRTVTTGTSDGTERSSEPLAVIAGLRLVAMMSAQLQIPVRLYLTIVTSGVCVEKSYATWKSN